MGVLFCIRMPNFIQIGTFTAEIWRHIDFEDGGRQPWCICFDVMADHPRSVVRGLNSVLKSLVRRTNNSGDFAMYRFWRFGLKLPIHPPFWGSLWSYFPIWRHPLSWPPKWRSLGGSTSFEPFNVRISATVRPGRVREKKLQDNKKVTKVLYFPYLWGSRHLTDSTRKLGGGWCPRRNHECQVSNWNLHGLRFYRGSNFRFSYWFLRGPYNIAALMWCINYFTF